MASPGQMAIHFSQPMQTCVSPVKVGTWRISFGSIKIKHFGQIDNAFIRAVGAKGNEIARYGLSNDPTYENQCSMIFGEVYRKDNDWKFHATGNAYYSDSFVEILKSYV